MGSPRGNRALWLSSYSEPLRIVDLPVPEAPTGTAVVKILATGIVPYTHLCHTGKLPQMNIHPPFVPNPNAIGRVHAVGPDAVRVKPGDLVYVDATTRGRDDPINVMVMIGHLGGAGDAGQKLMKEWRDGSLQQYQKVPLENVYLLNEQRLTGELGYGPAELSTIAHYSVVGGALLEAADVKVAETVVVGPSGGSFGGLAVEVALTVGCNVVALGRSEAKLAAMREKLGGNARLRTVLMTGDEDADAAAILAATPYGAGADVYNDWTPGGLKNPPYLGAALRTLKREGRVVLSGGASETLPMPYAQFGLKNLKLLGKWMCERRTLLQVISMIEGGQLRIGKESGSEIKVFTLDQHEEATEFARVNGGWRNYTVIAPSPYETSLAI
ncbi:Putative GroES-like superfamily, alcohol dehydrogenase-like, NAD(P)-binding domain superfamily [Colletotrichum destructivum]|uniref:GroES-like superfamily, alcohol dehydrogenase-like, NAD(P)-binding domain superfamily n=1 Tax=Colletotrichum destructivum TaxID=34406 RepID=A0AAX4I2H9_9PEZI|nr:Putative GroES-like superfamily, alcohol dehydrogenase-like, NAD(P)-binding domain superfamily [Colletotrichum destructivum]